MKRPNVDIVRNLDHVVWTDEVSFFVVNMNKSYNNQTI